MDEILPVETGMWRCENLLRNGFKCSLGSPPRPLISMLTGKIFTMWTPPVRKGRFNIEPGGQGGMPVLDDPESCACNIFELAKFRPSTVSGDGLGILALMATCSVTLLC